MVAASVAVFIPPTAFTTLVHAASNITRPKGALAEDQPSNSKANRTCGKPSGDLSGIGVAENLASPPVVALALLVSVVPEFRRRIKGAARSILELVRDVAAALRALVAAHRLVLRRIARFSHVILQRVFGADQLPSSWPL